MKHMKQMMNLNATGLTNRVKLICKAAVRQDLTDDEVRQSAQKLLDMISQIDREQCMGWQMTLGEKIEPEVLASENLPVTIEDYEWIYGPWAEVKKAEEVQSSEEEYPRIYAIYSTLSNPFTVNISPADCKELIGKLTGLGAKIRYAKSGGNERSGVLLLGLKEEMPLYLKGMISRAFRGVGIEEVNANSDSTELEQESAKEETFPEKQLYEKDAVNVLSYLFAEILRNTLPDRNEDEHKNTHYTDDSLIAELCLSVRAYNCLRRAGVCTIGDLKKLSRADLRMIRNLGRLGYNNIIEALEAAGIALADDNETKEQGQEEHLITNVEEDVQETPDESSEDSSQEASAEKSQEEKKVVDYRKQLEELIGLPGVKEQVKKVAAFARMKKDIAQMPVISEREIPMVLNMSFEGNPGTAKTTVARILAGILAEQGILSSGEVVEVGRADLVGKYVGHTADQVKQIFEKAKGKLLFIDEAYSLVDDKEHSFGDEAINTIVQEMENQRQETIVVFAGYPEKMEAFFKRNPGLKSRVPFHITFQDYDVEEMVNITELEAKKRGFTCSEEARKRIHILCEQEKREKDFGNGRYCRNLAENGVLNYAVRKYGLETQTDSQAEDQVIQLDFILTEEEFPLPAVPEEKKEKRPIGFHYMASETLCS